MAQVCELNDLQESNECLKKGSIKVAYYIAFDDVDWATMAADPLQWNPTTEEILGFTLLGGAVFKKINPHIQGSFYTQSFTSDAQTYETALNFLFENKGRVLRNNLCKASKCCRLIFYVIDNNCKERLFGVDWDGEVFEIAINPLEMTQHDDNSGDLGGDQPSDTVIFGGNTICSATYGDIGRLAFEAAYT